MQKFYTNSQASYNLIMKRILNLFVLFIFTVSCASTTIIKTNDPNVKLYVDGEYVGMGSAVYTDRSVSFTTRTVTLEKNECNKQFESFSRSGNFDSAAVIFGILTIVPLLWMKNYSAVENFEFNCESSLK